MEPVRSSGMFDHNGVLQAAQFALVIGPEKQRFMPVCAAGTNGPPCPSLFGCLQQRSQADRIARGVLHRIEKSSPTRHVKRRGAVGQGWRCREQPQPGGSLLPLGRIFPSEQRTSRESAMSTDTPACHHEPCAARPANKPPHAARWSVICPPKRGHFLTVSNLITSSYWRCNAGDVCR